MTFREKAPLGAPCWVDLWTGDVDGSRSFYSDVFGWTAEETNPEFGGYYIWTRNGIPVAGGMGDMGSLVANNTWSVFFASPSCAQTIERAIAAGATETVPQMSIVDLGSQAIVDHEAAGHLGIWQAENFEGFTMLNEHGAPSWFELHTRDFANSVAFCESVLGWSTEVTGDTDDFRYVTMRDPNGEGFLAGIMDATNALPDGAPNHWSVYFEVDDVDASVQVITSLGGNVVLEAMDTPFGRLATVTDPAGAEFRLRKS